jgi:hypothetical protein
MADTKLSELPVKSTTVDLTADVFAVVSGGVTEQVPANLIPFTKILTANTSIYIATTGNDSTGDGSVGLPYLTPHKAYEHLQDYFLGAGVIATIQCAAGTYTIASTLIPYHPQGSQVLLKGATMLGTVVDGDFVASAVTTTTNLETRFATVFRGNFADNLIDSDIHGSNLIFKVEDILVDCDSVSTDGINITDGASTILSGSVSIISAASNGLKAENGSIVRTSGIATTSHTGLGVMIDSGSVASIDSLICPYNSNDGVRANNRSIIFITSSTVRDCGGAGIRALSASSVEVTASVSSSSNSVADYYSLAESYMLLSSSALSSGQSVTAFNRSSIDTASVGGVTYSPTFNVNGNNDSLIY